MADLKAAASPGAEDAKAEANGGEPAAIADGSKAANAGSEGMEPDGNAPHADAGANGAAAPGAPADKPGGDAADDGKDDKSSSDSDSGDEEEDAGQDATKQKRGLLDRLRNLRGGDRGEAGASDTRKRTFDLTVALRGMQNVTTEKMLKVFFSISCNHESNHRRNVPGILPKFTGIYWLPKSEQKTLDVPLIIHNRRKMRLSYKDLAKFGVQIDMWQVSSWTFNTYYGVVRKSFADIVTREASQTILIKKKLNRQQLADKKKRSMVWEVATFDCIIQFEEYYRFILVGDHWSLDMTKVDCGDCRMTEKEFKKRMAKRNRLYFQVPPNKNVLVDRAGLGIFGGKPQNKFIHWNKNDPETGKPAFWNDVGRYHFLGTRTDLRQAYFIVSIYCGEPSPFTVKNPGLQAKSPLQSNATVWGKAMLTFTAILDISVLKGVVKQLKGVEMLKVGDLTGNMKCKELSIGVDENNVDLGNKWTKLYGPGQPQVSGTVTHLNKNEKHLVVKVKSCRYLPLSQPEKGCSNPLLRVKWDNMEQKCPQMFETVRPIFNFNFYFPVRSVFMKKLKGKKNVQDLWIAELGTKGSIKIEVWDDDRSTSDFLGKCEIDMADIMNSKLKEERDILGPIKAVKKNEDDDDDEDAPPPDTGKQWYQIPVKTRIYDCKNSGLPLQGSTIGGAAGIPTIYFETYFYQDIDKVKEVDDSEDVAGAKEDTFWKQVQRTFEFQMQYFQKSQYLVAFPNAIGAKDTMPKGGRNNPQSGEQVRRFTDMVVDFEGDGPEDLTPLMRFLVPIIVPESLSMPVDKIHWIHCLTWEVTSSKQLKTGLIPPDGWKPPSFILQKRKGAAQDHALVLCSLLMGASYEAYVCKGTVYAMMPAAEGHGEQLQLVEHCWVMTREEGWVTFWEPMNGKIYHLPNRYTEKVEEEEDTGKKKKKKKKAEDEEAIEEDPDDKPPELLWEGEAPDQKVMQEEIDALPTTKRQPKAKARVDSKRRNEIDISQQKKEKIIADRENLPIAPHKALLESNTLVNYLPYDSIDVVFNDRNIYANRQNHNPALILYDFPDEKEPFKEEDQWLAWLQPKDIKRMEEEDIDINALGDQNVSLQRPFSGDVAEQLRHEILSELEENLRLYRSKLGYDCMFDRSEYVLRELGNFLDMQELCATLDPDAIGKNRGEADISFKDGKLSNGQTFEEYVRKLLNNDEGYIKKILGGNHPTKAPELSHNKHGSVFLTSKQAKYANYRNQLKTRFAKLERMIDDFMDKKDEFPVKRDKELKGITVHFCCSDVDDIRSYLMNLEEYENLINVKDEEIVYVLQARVFPLSGGVQSVWVYVGAQVKCQEEKAKKKDDV